jgi:hypothetical protein
MFACDTIHIYKFSAISNICFHLILFCNLRWISIFFKFVHAKIWWRRHIPPGPQGSSEWAGPKNDTSSSQAPHADTTSSLMAPPTCYHVSIAGPTCQLPCHLRRPHAKVTRHRLGPHLSDATSSLWVPPVSCHISIVGSTYQLPR